MSWNFPGNRDEEREAFRQALNFLKCEVEQIKKHQLPTPDNLIGAPIGGPLAADLTELPFDPDPPGGDGGSGGETKVVVLGKILAGSAKSSVATVQVEPWMKDPANAGHKKDNSASIINAYPILGGVQAGKFCVLNLDIDTGKWYVIGAECT